MEIILLYIGIISLFLSTIGFIISLVIIPYLIRRNIRVGEFRIKLIHNGYNIKKLKPHSKMLYSFRKLKIENYILK